ncbi:MAG: AAA family ATPase [Deltaproteobacteria bacterium]|nr:AAA family ATPase [Deltaproteobacteria bacterium]
MSAIKLDARIKQDLRATYETIMRNGELLSVDRIRVSYEVFRDRFGPDKLGALDGDALLQAMHSHGNKDSLVYWLEFKNDEDFPGQVFGSISGGSAHKFGLFKRKETGQWVTGGPRKEENIDEPHAVAIARKHRDQLLAGVAVLEKLAVGADDAAYRGLQNDLGRVAPDLYNLAWAHKYFSLLFPEKLDDYHNAEYQRFHLIKLLQKPPEDDGLYVCAGRFVNLATLLGLPLIQLTAVLNKRNGRPIRYWRMGTRLGATESIWQDMLNGPYVAIGWEAIGDLSGLRTAEDVRGEIRKLLEQHYPGDPKVVSRKAGEIRNFLTEIKEGDGDIVVAADGETVLAIGRVTGPYRFENTAPTGAPHRRSVTWVSTAEWKMPESEGLRTTVFPLKKHVENLIEIERRSLDGAVTPTTVVRPAGVPVAGPQRLEGIPGRMQSILERKGQAILYGPPGTGKTYWARQTAFDLAALGAYGRLFGDLSPEEKTKVDGNDTVAGLVRCCTFHPSYGYEDFIEGYRPKSIGGQLSFTLERGIFQAICEDARGKSEKYVLLIDEINRGDIPRIFGELLTLLELDKRGQSVVLPLSGKLFAVPANLYVVGTMNTADRSIALLDTALRRRFGFVELMPDVEVFRNALIGESIPLGPWLAALNGRIRGHLGRDGRNLQIGHAYLLEGGKPVTDFARFVRILADDIIPLVGEYCYEDYGALTQILGVGLVDEARQRIREELFVLARREELVQALLAPSPEIVTSPDAVAVTEVADDPDDPETKGNES